MEEDSSSIRCILLFVFSLRSAVFQPLIESEIRVDCWNVRLLGSSFSILRRMNESAASRESSFLICPSASNLKRLHFSRKAISMSLSSKRCQLGMALGPHANFRYFDTSIAISLATLSLHKFPSTFVRNFWNVTKLGSVRG